MVHRLLEKKCSCGRNMGKIRLKDRTKIILYRMAGFAAYGVVISVSVKLLTVFATGADVPLEGLLRSAVSGGIGFAFAGFVFSRSWRRSRREQSSREHGIEFTSFGKHRRRLFLLSIFPILPLMLVAVCCMWGLITRFHIDPPVIVFSYIAMALISAAGTLYYTRLFIRTLSGPYRP